jgi:hypothetical protein
MGNSVFYGTPIGAILETLERKNILMEWRLGNLELTLPPQKIVSHFSTAYGELLREKDGEISQEIELMGRYINLAHRAIRRFETTIENDFQLLQAALHLMVHEVRNTKNIMVKYSIALDDVPAEFIPSCMILPYVSAIFRSMRHKSDTELHIRYSRCSSTTLKCSISSKNCFFYNAIDEFGVAVEPILIQRREVLLKQLLGETAKTTIRGNVAHSREEALNFYRTGKASSEIDLYVPILSEDLIEVINTDEETMPEEFSV